MDFAEIETTRFILKEIQDEDRPFIFEGLSNPLVIPYCGVQYDSLEGTGAQMDFYRKIWEEKTGCWWKIEDRIQKIPVGACGINYYSPVHEKAEIGYWLLPAFWKKGIMKEVIPPLINYVFSHWKLHRLEAIIEVGNEASCKLSESLGFRLDGLMREAEIKNGRRVSLLVYSLLKTDIT